MGLCFLWLIFKQWHLRGQTQRYIKRQLSKFHSGLYPMERWVDLFPKYSELSNTYILQLRKLSSVIVSSHSAFRAPWAVPPTVISGCGEPTCLFSNGQQKVDFPAGWANSHLLEWNRADSKHGICHFVWYQEAASEIQGPFRATTPYESDSWEKGNPKLETLDSLEGHSSICWCLRDTLNDALPWTTVLRLLLFSGSSSGFSTWQRVGTPRVALSCMHLKPTLQT